MRSELDEWVAAAAIDRGKLFRRVNRVGKTWGEGMSEKAVWHIVKESARSIGAAKLGQFPNRHIPNVLRLSWRASVAMTNR